MRPSDLVPMSFWGPRKPFISVLESKELLLNTRRKHAI
uniref:Uncharacterized protein n=1 Tax=Rhizophora mucronata TaxID=61149 RepID=A0A2P2QC61_RHIMU